MKVTSRKVRLAFRFTNRLKTIKQTARQLSVSTLTVVITKQQISVFRKPFAVKCPIGF